MTIVWSTRPVPSTRARQVWIAVAATLGLLVVVSLSASAPSQSRGSGRVAIAIGDASSALPLYAKMNIAPAPVVDPSAEGFVGTGDGSNGSWIRP
jgi:hypothetical protein